MKFPGYWVDGQGAAVTVTFEHLDDTELSEDSNWRRAHQNGDADCPSGFVDPVEALLEVCKRVRGNQLWVATAPSEGENVVIHTLEDLAHATIKMLGGSSPVQQSASAGVQ